MKIAMFGHKRIPSRAGGVEVVVENLAARMAKRGHTVVCYNRGRSRRCAERKQLPTGVQLKEVPAWKGAGADAVSSSIFAAAAVAFSDSQVVHIHAEGPAAMCWLPKLLGKRVVVTVHGLDWQREKWKGSLGARYIRFGEKMAVRFADTIIVLSRNMQQYFRREYNRDTVWIPNGMERPVGVPADQILHGFGLEKDSYLLFLGRLVPEKGIHHLLEAFRTVSTDKQLVIAGEVPEHDGYAQKLKTMAQDDSRIVFTGFAEGKLLEELYSNAYAWVLPSGLEGMPMGLLEAISYGNCCLISDIPECTELAGEAALCFPAGDVPALRQKLQQLCDDPTLVEEYRNRARNQTFRSWEEVTEQTLRVYQCIF